MAFRRLTIPLDERACTLALGPYSSGYSLRPESRAAIERAKRLGITVREVTCTSDEACDMLDYFRSAADALTAIGDPEGPVCSPVTALEPSMGAPRCSST
jgi:hypothetical protein